MQPVTTESLDATPPRILVVDDKAENLVALEATLGDVAQVVSAQSGEEALRQLLNGEFAVVLLDVQMPGMDGYETARILRGRPRNRDTPIVFLTAVSQAEEQVRRGYEVGAIDYLFKPFSPSVLRAKVGALVEITRQRRALEEEVRRRRAAEGAVQRMVEDLDRRVAERTRELERANEELLAQAEVNAQLRRQLEEGARRKDEFLAVLGHELRNPLAALSNACAGLPRGDEALPAEPDLAQILSRQVERLTRLVDDLLDVGRIAQGRLALQRSRLDMVAVVSRAAESMRHRLEEREQRLECRLPDEPVPTTGDAVRIEQVVCNLLDNAIKYTQKGGHVELRLACTDGRIRVHVKDDGPGIAPAQRREVFELFSRGTLDLSAPGLGVGLALCRQIAKLHGGRVELAAENGRRGSEFILDLPRVDAGSVRPAAAPLAAREDGRSKPLRRVLIVEDNADAALSLSYLLRTWGAESAVAGDAAAALVLADEFRPDLVLLDIGLPGESGYTVARELRERYGDGVRLVAVTGFGRDDDRRQALAAGCDVHMTKPVAPARLRELLGPTSRRSRA